MNQVKNEVKNCNLKCGNAARNVSTTFNRNQTIIEVKGEDFRKNTSKEEDFRKNTSKKDFRKNASKRE